MNWRIKPLADLFAAAEKKPLGRTLGPFQLVMLGVGTVIGTGIFVLSAEAAQKAGPGMMVSFVLAAFTCAFTALCYAELASMVPLSGSAYTYSYGVLGELVAWMVGWALILEYAVAASAVSVGWSNYFVGLLERSFSIDIPDALTRGPYVGGLINLPAVAIGLLMTSLLVIGTRTSATVNAVLATIKVLALVVFVALSVPVLQMDNFHPFAPNGFLGEISGMGIAGAAASIFFAYIGFDAVSTAAQEAKNPQRDMPIGILGSLGICTLLYVIVSLTLTGLVHYSKLNVAHPVAFAVEQISGLSWLRPFITLGAVLGLGSVVLVMLLGQSRVFYSMSRDGLIGPWAGKVHPRYRTPYLSTIYVGLIVAVISATFPIQILGELVNIGTLLAFVLVCIGVWILRRTRPDLDRPFRTPLVPLVPILGVLSCLGLMATLPGDTWLRLFVWLLIGFVIYFAYGRKHSHLQRELAAQGSTGRRV
jgi:basic amino acid/polyamine antiporter, APA family